DTRRSIACARWSRSQLNCRTTWRSRLIWPMSRTLASWTSKGTLFLGTRLQWPQLSMKKPAGAYILDSWIIESFGVRIMKTTGTRWWLNAREEICISLLQISRVIVVFLRPEGPSFNSRDREVVVIGVGNDCRGP